jgi:hypothetical protein
MFILNTNLISELFISYEKLECEQAESFLCTAQFIAQGKSEAPFQIWSGDGMISLALK